MTKALLASTLMALSIAAGCGNGTGGDASAVPSWQPLASAPLGCPVQRMVNAAQVRAFSWQPCPGVAGCEQIVPNPVLGVINFAPRNVEEEPDQTRVILETEDDHGNIGVLFAGEDGWLLDAYQASSSPPSDCLMLAHAGAAWGSRYGVLLATSAGQIGGLLHTFGDPADPLPFAVTQTSFPFEIFSTVGDAPMGATRWAWRTGAGLVSVSTADGGDLAFLTASTSPDPGASAFAVDQVRTNGSTFLFGEARQPADSGATGILATSDGKSAAAPYLTPTDGSAYIFPVYAGSHVAWFRGIGHTGQPHDSTYQAIELWASPYSADPAGLAPFKVDDYPQQGIGAAYGAAGRVAASVGVATDYPMSWHAAVWDLATKQRTVYPNPSGFIEAAPFGITSKYVWVGAASGTGADDTTISYSYARFALE
jgi:hypothetical protein